MPAVSRGAQQQQPQLSLSMSADPQAASDSDKEASGSPWLRYTWLLRQRTGRAVSHYRSLLLPAAALAALLFLIVLASSQSPLSAQQAAGGSSGSGLRARHSPARSSSLRDFLTESSSDSSAADGADDAAAESSPALPPVAPQPPPSPAPEPLPAASAGLLPFADSAAAGEFFWTEAVLSAAEEERPSPLSAAPQSVVPRCRLTRFNILGERCSGTNAMQKLLTANFHIEVTQDFHHKHFFGFPDPAHPLHEADCVLFVGSVRHPVDWLSSFYHNLWQLDQWQFTSWSAFLTLPIVSYAEPKMNKTLERYSPSRRADKRAEMLRREIRRDRNPAAPERHWRDVFELRRVKLLYMLDAFPQLVRNYVLVRTEDLVTHSAAFLDLLEARFNLSRRRPQQPVVVRSHRHTLPPDVESFVMQHLDLQVERRFGYPHLSPQQRSRAERQSSSGSLQQAAAALGRLAAGLGGSNAAPAQQAKRAGREQQRSRRERGEQGRACQLQRSGAAKLRPLSSGRGAAVAQREWLCELRLSVAAAAAAAAALCPLLRLLHTSQHSPRLSPQRRPPHGSSLLTSAQASGQTADGLSNEQDLFEHSPLLASYD